jgi:glycerol-3-phosphate acyltransferase PlsX
MRIIVDGFGGDNAPLAPLQGAAAAVAAYPDVFVLITGDETVLRQTAQENNIPLDRIELVHAPDIISMHDDPVSLLKAKSQSSMAVAFSLLKEGKGDAFVSGGSTGAIVVGANFIIKRIKGIKRAGLATVIPTINGCYLLMDAGANIDCKPETLLHFGLMGSIYMQRVQGVQNPRVGLVNVGSEDTKGGELQLAAYALLKEAPIQFVGNVEAREIPGGAVDVAVADGFTGNIILKLTEGLASMFSKKLKGMFLSGFSGKLAAALMMKQVREFKKSMDYTEYGGAPLLGAAKPVIKAHGSSNAYAFQNAIRQANQFAKADVTGEIEAALLQLKGQENE